MWALLVISAALLGGDSASASANAAGSEVVYSDTKLGITIQSFQTPAETVIFSSRLPEGWSFQISIDGDQDGKWGMGSGTPDPSIETSPDRSFGQSSKNGALCSQYVFSSHPNNPTDIYMSSDCGALKSNGRVIMTGYDGNKMFEVSFEIPEAELFNGLPNARIEACVWNTELWKCQHRLPNLLHLKRKDTNGHPPDGVEVGKPSD